ncbi:hypothetical protein ACIOZL_30490 [Streptomyces sp. NPDC087769]|uniref:hypothetical protein n=1 Tax=Streptomyces sp. NPDC087769 TaxID=3365802 RepID=UPI0037FCD05E
MHPADLMTGADDLFELPRHRQVVDRRPAGADHDALTVVTALAHADSPLTADGLAAALSWTRRRTDAAPDHARAHPDTGGALVLRHVPPEAFTVAPRLDALAPHQVDAPDRRRPHEMMISHLSTMLRRPGLRPSRTKESAQGDVVWALPAVGYWTPRARSCGCPRAGGNR